MELNPSDILGFHDIPRRDLPPVVAPLSYDKGRISAMTANTMAQNMDLSMQRPNAAVKTQQGGMPKQPITQVQPAQKPPKQPITQIETAYKPPKQPENKAESAVVKADKA